MYTCIVLDQSIHGHYQVVEVRGPYPTQHDADLAALALTADLNRRDAYSGIEPIRVVVRPLKAPA